MSKKFVTLFHLGDQLLTSKGLDNPLTNNNDIDTTTNRVSITYIHIFKGKLWILKILAVLKILEGVLKFKKSFLSIFKIYIPFNNFKIDNYTQNT